MEYIKELIKEKEIEIDELEEDLGALLKEAFEINEKYKTAMKVLHKYHDMLLEKDIEIQTLMDKIGCNNDGWDI